MSDKSNGYSSKEDDDYSNNEEEEEDKEKDEELNNDNNNNKIIQEKNNDNNNKKEKNVKMSDKNIEAKINTNIIMKETEKDKIINQLKKELQEKNSKIKLIIKTNNKLKQSLENFSKQVDIKLINGKNNKNLFEKISNLKTKNLILKSKLNNTLKEKELNNAINMIKILRNDNMRLQAFVDDYEKDKHLQELENINKKQICENTNLEQQIKTLKEKLSDFNNYVKKNKSMEKQIEILTKENKYLKDNIKSLNNQLYIKNLKNEIRNIDGKTFSSKRRKFSLIKLDNSTKSQNSIFNTYKININPINKNKKNSLNNYSLYSKHDSLIINPKQNSTSLPSLKTPNNISPINTRNNSLNKIISLKKNYKKNIDNILPQFFTQEEIDLINNKLFRNNVQSLEAFKIKLCILNKSKETLDNKYKNEIKKLQERLTSAQDQINYLNSKIRGLEINCQILQTQKNEDIIRKKIQQKKIQNLEKNLKEKDRILQLYLNNNIDINNINNKKNKIDENQNEKNDSISIKNLENNNQSKKESTEKSQEDENSSSKEDSEK